MARTLQESLTNSRLTATCRGLVSSCDRNQANLGITLGWQRSGILYVDCANGSRKPEFGFVFSRMMDWGYSRE